MWVWLRFNIGLAGTKLKSRVTLDKRLQRVWLTFYLRKKKEFLGTFTQIPPPSQYKKVYSIYHKWGKKQFQTSYYKRGKQNRAIILDTHMKATILHQHTKNEWRPINCKGYYSPNKSIIIVMNSNETHTPKTLKNKLNPQTTATKEERHLHT